MEQMNFSYGLAMICHTRTVPHDQIMKAKNYREALQWCRQVSKRRVASHRTIAEETGMRETHLSQYFNTSPTSDSGHKYRCLPAEMIPVIEKFYGNTFISQWLAYQAGLTVLEEIQLARAA